MKVSDRYETKVHSGRRSYAQCAPVARRWTSSASAGRCSSSGTCSSARSATRHPVGPARDRDESPGAAPARSRGAEPGRARAAAPAPGTTVYRLTATGRPGAGSERPRALGLSSSSDAAADGRHAPGSVLVSLHASFKPVAARGLRERYAFRVDDRIFEVAWRRDVHRPRGRGVIAGCALHHRRVDALRAPAARAHAAQAIAAAGCASDGERALDRFVGAFAWSKDGAGAHRGA